MARGNQRENARKKNEKKNASKVCPLSPPLLLSSLLPHLHLLKNSTLTSVQKGGTNLDGTTLQKKKEDDAAKMRLKQAAGTPLTLLDDRIPFGRLPILSSFMKYLANPLFFVTNSRCQKVRGPQEMIGH